MYEDIYDAKTAVEHLSGFNVANRYLIVLYYNHQKHSKKVGVSGGCAVLFKVMVSFSDMTCGDLPDQPLPFSSMFVLTSCSVLVQHLQWLTVEVLQLSTKDKEEELLKMQEKYGVDAEQHPQKRK